MPDEELPEEALEDQPEGDPEPAAASDPDQVEGEVEDVEPEAQE
jgi:hypothetical protein